MNSNTLSVRERQFADLLKSIARSPELKSAVRHSPELYRLLRRAARRYVAGEKREDALDAARRLAEQGYTVSLEYIGENTATEEECMRAAEEFGSLIKAAGRLGLAARISLDLSHIGLSVHPELAYRNLNELARQAEEHGLHMMISMEESAKTDDILSVYKRSALRYANIGITLQAQLHRTERDLAELAGLPGSIRIVKGAYREPEGICLPRSEQLDERYWRLVGACIEAGRSVSIATNDERLIEEAAGSGFLGNPNAELEMLYGIRPDISRRRKDAGTPVRIYVTYGDEWFLYFCHRIAEYPPSLYTAVTDMIEGAADSVRSYYS